MPPEMRHAYGLESRPSSCMNANTFITHGNVSFKHMSPESKRGTSRLSPPSASP